MTQEEYDEHKDSYDKHWVPRHAFDGLWLDYCEVVEEIRAHQEKGSHHLATKFDNRLWEVIDYHGKHNINRTSSR